jgi:hypothetical protein
MYGTEKFPIGLGAAIIMRNISPIAVRKNGLALIRRGSAALHRFHATLGWVNMSARDNGNFPNQIETRIGCRGQVSSE